MNDELSYQDAAAIYEEILANRKTADGAADDLYEDLYKKAVRYAHIRALWHSYTVRERAEGDSGRTMAHDSFISAVNIVARLQGEKGAAWREQLGEDRKRIGDFACYLALFLAIQER